jgi:hypothetical protein
MNQMNVQTLVATSQDDAKATAKELLAKVEDGVSATARCLDYALSANNRLFEQLESACKHVLDQLTRVAMDPKSLDTIKRGDWAKPAEQPQQQAQASELEQLKKKVQDQTAEIEGLKALLEQRDAAHAGEVARLQAQINSLAPNPFQKLAACCFVKKPAVTKVLKIRRTGHVIESLIRNPNKFCPDFGQLDYENDLVAIQHVFPHKGYFHGFNF